MSEPKSKHIFPSDEVYKLHSSKWLDTAVSLMKQAALTMVIFGVLFVIMNWSAIWQITSWKWQKMTTNVVQNNVLNDFTKKEKPEQKPLPFIGNINIAKKQIPEIAMKVAPPDTRIIIPRINKNVPIVAVNTQNLIKKDWNALEKDMQRALQYGVISYPGTAKPGTPGNVVLTGHSSYFPWDQGRFKDVFALLHDVVLDDSIILYHDQKKYIYKVTKKFEVKASDLKILEQQGENKLTLLTCTPVGTNLRRLIVEAKLISIES